jgi:hypothetical protein
MIGRCRDGGEKTGRFLEKGASTNLSFHREVKNSMFEWENLCAGSYPGIKDRPGKFSSWIPLSCRRPRSPDQTRHSIGTGTSKFDPASIVGELDS